METTVITRLGRTGFFNRKNSKLLIALVRATKGEDLDFCEIALSPKTPTHVLKSLLETGQDEIIEMLTRNPKLPASLALKILHLEATKHYFGRYVRANCKINSEFFAEIIKRGDDIPALLDSIAEVAANTKVSVSVIRGCYNIALHDENTIANFGYQRTILLHILGNTKTPLDLMRPAYNSYSKVLNKRYYGEENAQDRAQEMQDADDMLASNPQCPLGLFHKIMQSGNVTTLRLGAKNPLLFAPSKENTLLQEKLWNDKSSNDDDSDPLWKTLTENPSCSEHYLTGLAKIKGDYNLRTYQRKLFTETAFGKALSTEAIIRVLETYRAFSTDKRGKELAAEKIARLQKPQNKRSPKKKK
jgi:hypothetical protein